MYDTTEAFRVAFKPYDVVTDGFGNVGFIVEVNINSSQTKLENQLTYSVDWMVGMAKAAWWKHGTLTKHCNIFLKIAENGCHPFGNARKDVKTLLGL